MKWMSLLLLATIASSAQAHSTAPSTKNNYISGFVYTSCTIGDQGSCVLIQSPHAYMGLKLDTFSTQGETTLTVTDAKGATKANYVGATATLNPQLNTVVLERKDSSFLLYSLKDGSVTDYSASLGKK